jgi:hypothetical protein
MTKEELIDFLKDNLKVSLKIKDKINNNDLIFTVKLFFDLDGKEILISEDSSTLWM